MLTTIRSEGDLGGTCIHGFSGRDSTWNRSIGYLLEIMFIFAFPPDVIWRECARSPRVKIRNTQIGHHIIIGVITVIIIISIIITVVITRRSSTSNSRVKHACIFLVRFFSVRKRFSSFIFILHVFFSELLRPPESA